MNVLMRTAFTDDYHTRVKALDDITTDCNLHTVVQSVKTASNTVMSSALMQQLQQQICGNDHCNVYSIKLMHRCMYLIS